MTGPDRAAVVAPRASDPWRDDRQPGPEAPSAVAGSEERGRLSRRMLMVGGAAGLAPMAAAAQPRTGTSDSDPRDPAGRGRPYTGQSDSDPRDAAGRGRPRTGLSDSDPRDAAGRGRPRTGFSDSDPRDAAGRGRGSR